MKFAQNRLYIESYNKCPNCGLLLYEKPSGAAPETVVSGGKTYCSRWCVDWEREREQRRQSATGQPEAEMPP